MSRHILISGHFSTHFLFSKHFLNLNKVCELIGLYILQELKNILPNFIIGLYRDDGLIVVDKKLSNVEIEKINKKLHKFTKSIGINIIIKKPILEN